MPEDWRPIITKNGTAVTACRIGVKPCAYGKGTMWCGCGQIAVWHSHGWVLCDQCMVLKILCGEISWA